MEFVIEKKLFDSTMKQVLFGRMGTLEDLVDLALERSTLTLVATGTKVEVPVVRPHDGSIDGVIKEDKLGLDLIYIQAKKWKDTTVGSTEVQSSVGALAGGKARRGVFITTSKFSREATAYAASLENRVILFDGDRLTDLMFEYGLGVSTLNTYAVKRVDNDFFDEDEL